MSVLRRLLIFSLNYDLTSEIENTLSAAQSQTILRFLFGSLAETWEMLKRPVNQSLIGKIYAETIEPEGTASYTKLKRHFGETNLLHKLRNTVAYHHPEGAELAEAFEDVPEDEDWAWYPSDTINNSYYLASDFVISARILKLTGKSDTQKAFEKVMGLVVPVSNDLTDFLPLRHARDHYAAPRCQALNPSSWYRNEGRRRAQSLPSRRPIFYFSERLTPGMTFRAEGIDEAFAQDGVSL